MLEKYLSTLYMDFRGQVVNVIQGKPMDDNLNFTVDSFGSIVLSGGSTEENADQLRNFLKQKKITAGKVIAGLGNQGIITRNVRVPKMETTDLDNMMKLNINDYLPVSVDEYAFDYKVLREIEEDGNEQLEVMVAGVKHHQIEYYASLLECIGLKPMVFDILPNMLQRLFDHLFYQNIMIIDSGIDGTHAVILKENSMFMYADIPFNCNLNDDNNLSMLTSEIRGYMDYFASRNFGKALDGITILGNLAIIPNIGEALAEHLSIPITVGLSQAGPLYFKGKASDFKDWSSVYAGILGLMMRGKTNLINDTNANPNYQYKSTSGLTFSS